MKFILTLVTLFVTLISVPNKTAKSNDTKSVYASSDSNASSMVSNASLSNTQVNQLFNSLDSGSINGVNYNFSFESISKSTKCSEGCYKVALVIAPNQDYHWYRQNSDGTWSHKPGNGYVIKTDYQSQVIYDPQYCDRRYNYGGTVINYSVFCGFYQVNISNINVDIYGG